MLLDELSIWNCIHCGTENDHTNATRCWSCNKKKDKLSTVKRILAKRKKDEQAKKIKEKQEKMQQLDKLPETNDSERVFDLSHLNKTDLD